MEMGQLIDRLAKAREHVREARTKLEAVEDVYRHLENDVLNALTDAKLEKATGTLATASITKTLVPTVTDWGKVEKYILKHKAFDLLQRRMADKAWRARHEDGEEVPGTQPFTIVRLNLRAR